MGWGIDRHAGNHRFAGGALPSDGEGLRRLYEWFARLSDIVFGLLETTLPSPAAAPLLWSDRKLVRGEWRELVRLALLSTRALVEEHFESPEAQTLIASWGMHSDFSPEIPGGAMFALLETYTGIARGMALVSGGAGTLTDALVALLREFDGEVVTRAEVARVTVSGGRAAGVITAEGRSFRASRDLIANTGPRALFAEMLGSAASPELRRRARAYQYGAGTLMIHLAVDELPAWVAGQQLRDYAYVHVAPYLESRAG